METKALVSVEEYLTTSYEPGCDYIDGELVERNEGEGSVESTDLVLRARECEIVLPLPEVFAALEG